MRKVEKDGRRGERIKEGKRRKEGEEVEREGMCTEFRGERMRRTGGGTRKVEKEGAMEE